MSKKILGTFCVAVLGILAASAVVYIKSDALIQNEVQEHHRLLCENITHEVNDAFIRTRQIMTFTAARSAIANAAARHDREQSRKLLNSIEEQDSGENIPPLSLLDSKGNVLASSIFTAAQTDSYFFQEAIQGRFAIQGPEISKETNGASLLFAEPVMQDRRMAGVLVAHLDMTQLSINVLPLLRNMGLEHSFVLDAAGRILMHTNLDDLAGISLDEPWALEMLRKKRGRISYEWVGTRRVAVFAPVPQPGWVVAVSLRETDILSPQRTLRNYFIGGSLAVAALALALLYLLTRKIQFHLRAGSKLALAELGPELKLPSGAPPNDMAELLHFGLSTALEKAQQRGMLLEHAFANQRERLHAVFTSMMEGILRVDADGAVRFANPAAMRLLRYQEKDVLGRQARSLLLPPANFNTDKDDLSDLHQALNAAHTSTFTGRLLRCGDASLFLADIVVSPLHENGKADGTVIAISDASLVDAQRQMLSAISSAAGAVYFIWDEKCRLVDCADNCASFFLATDKNEVLNNFMAFMPKRQTNGRTSASELERHQLHALNTGGGNCDWLFKNAQDTPIPCDFSMRRLKIRGQSVVLGFARDMRSTLAAEEKLASIHANLKQVLDALPVAVGIVGKESLLYANRELEEFFALYANESALIPFVPVQNAVAPDQDFMQEINNRHLQLFNPDGNMRDYMLSCFPTEFCGAAALMGWIVDVTVLKNEQQRLVHERNQALEAIDLNKHALTQIGREVREPLNGMLFALQHAAQSGFDGGQAQAIEAAYELGKQVQNTLIHILNLSGMAPPTQLLEITQFNAAEFFHETLQDFAGEAELKGISFHILLDPALSAELVGRRALLRQVIYDLVDNAVKYTVAGGVTVDVALLPPIQENKALLHIMIADTGLGISKAQLDAMFRSFSDGVQNPNLLSKNTSFGLALVRSSIRLLEGELCVVSEPNLGTEMRLVLPFALRLPKEDLFPEAAEETLPFLQAPLEPAPLLQHGPKSTCGRGRILVVDDIAANMQIMILILQKMNYDAIGAESGAKALELLEHTSFDLIFMDIQMPHMSGTEVTARIRNDDAGRYPRDIPIVAMTAHAMLGDPEKYMAAGMNDYLSKPVIIEDIANILNNLLKR